MWYVEQSNRPSILMFLFISPKNWHCCNSYSIDGVWNSSSMETVNAF